MGSNLHGRARPPNEVERRQLLVDTCVVHQPVPLSSKMELESFLDDVSDEVLQDSQIPTSRS